MDPKNSMQNTQSSKIFPETWTPKSPFSVSSLLSDEYSNFRKTFQVPYSSRTEAVNHFLMPHISSCCCLENPIERLGNHPALSPELSKDEIPAEEEQRNVNTKSELCAMKMRSCWSKSEFSWFNRLSLCESTRATLLLPSQMQLARLGALPMINGNPGSLHSGWLPCLPYTSTDCRRGGTSIRK